MTRASSPPTAGEISARMDRLPPTRTVWAAILLLSAGMFFELYDLLFTAYVAPTLVKSGMLTPTTSNFFGLTGVAGFIAALFSGLFIGTLLCGFLADRFGRRRVAAGLVFSSQRALILSAMFADPADLPQRMLWLCVKVTSAVTLCVLALASADLVWTRIHWRRDLRMSRHEMKEEVRQAEGNRMRKASFRSLRLSMLRRRMLKAVPRATRVVVNPTHYAVASRYVRGEGPAPLVLAKGLDAIALKIRAVAEENNIPTARSIGIGAAVGSRIMEGTCPGLWWRGDSGLASSCRSDRRATPAIFARVDCRSVISAQPRRGLR